MNIGFVGVGKMGLPMARNLVEAGHAVTAFDLASAAVAAAVENGAAAADSAAAASAGADVVITMLPAGGHVRDVYGPSDGIIETVSPGTLLIDCSTIDVASARAVAAAARQSGLDMLDAPVSGGVSGAEAGTLTFMVGGEAAAFESARPILAAMGKTIVHAGASGNGQVAKICNNMILGVSIIAVSEAFTLGQKLGLDAKTLFDISSNASGSCWTMVNHAPVPGIVETAASNRDFKPGFATAMMLKDLRLAQQAAESVAAATPMGAQAAALYTLFSNAGNDDLDYTAIIKMIAGE